MKNRINGDSNRNHSHSLPYRSGQTKPLTFAQLLWLVNVLEARVRLNLLQPPSKTRWN